MIPAVSLLILLVFAVAVFVAAFALVPDGSRREVEERLGLQGVSPARVSPVVELFRPVIRLAVPLVRSVGLEPYRRNVERRFVNAGMAGVMSSNEFLAYMLVMAAIFWILFMGVFARLLLGLSPPLVVDMAVVAFGLFFPDLWLRGEVSRRQDEIRRALPYVMDLLTLSVEAGLDFAAGLTKVCEKSKAGPLVDELSFLLREVQVGASRQQALRNLAERCAMPELSSFAALLIQADLLGASIGPVLRAQSDLIRTQRYQRAERMGAQASQKILFPLILCIMPAVFLVIFGPIILNFVYGTGVVGG